MGHVSDSDIMVAVELPEVDGGEEALDENWDAIR
jgi:hypothetical protein